MSDIYKMKVHERIPLTNDEAVMRVPGGWIYTLQAGNTMNSCFVPFYPETKQYHQEEGAKPKIKLDVLQGKGEENG